MLLSAIKLIFIHIPKTGGNAIQSVLLPYSDDRKVVGVARDGKNQFEIEGEVTRTKHDGLATYARALGDQIESYRIMTVFRDPVDRALSMYFSPRRLARAGRDGLSFSHGEFGRVVDGMASAVSYLTVEGQLVRPNYILRFGQLDQDFQMALADLGLPRLALDLLNVSGDVSGLRRDLRRDAEVVAMVRERFAEDYAFAESIVGRDT